MNINPSEKKDVYKISLNRSQEDITGRGYTKAISNHTLTKAQWDVIQKILKK